MSTHLVTVAPTARYDDVVDLILAHGVSGVAVVDGSSRLLGVVTEADLLRREAVGALPVVLAGRAPQAERLDLARSGETAATLMSCPVVTASPDDDLPTTATKLLESGYRRLPVVADDGRLVGLIARRDLLVPAWGYPTRES
jgi:CBS domain-containing protein